MLIESPLALNPGKYALAIHTASPELGLAIQNVVDEGVIEVRSHTWQLERAMSTHLHQHLIDFISPQQWRDLAFIAVAKGPGGFTGTRIGIVTARTLAQQLNIPLFAISTLAACGWATWRMALKERPQYIQTHPSAHQSNHPSVQQFFQQSTVPQRAIDPPLNDIAVEMSARRGDVFGAIYTPKRPDLPQSDTLHRSTLQNVAFASTIPETVIAESQWRQMLDNWTSPYILIQADGNLGWTAPYLLELAYQRWCQGDRPHWSDALPFYGQSPV